MSDDGRTYLFLLLEDVYPTFAELREFDTVVSRLLPLTDGVGYVDVQDAQISITISSGSAAEQVRSAARCANLLRDEVWHVRHCGREVVMRVGIDHVSSDEVTKGTTMARILAVSGTPMQATVSSSVASLLADDYLLVDRLPFEIYGKKEDIFYLGGKKV